MGEGWGPTTDLLITAKHFRHEYSVLFQETWQKRGLVDDGVVFVWPR